MKTVKTAFEFTFGPACGSYSVTIPSGAPVQWHEENRCYYVNPSHFADNGFVKHDATYYGVKVKSENVQ